MNPINYHLKVDERWNQALIFTFHPKSMLCLFFCVAIYYAWMSHEIHCTLCLSRPGVPISVEPDAINTSCGFLSSDLTGYILNQ